MKWLPRSISGQLLALWIVAILLAHLIAVLALSWWRSDNIAIHPLSARTIETRILAAYKAAGHEAQASRLLEDISLPDSEFRLLAAPGARNPDSRWSSQEAALAQAIRSRLELSSDTPLHVQLLNALPSGAGLKDGRNWIEKAFKSQHALAMDVEVLLPDQRWLYSRHWPTLVPAHWSRVLSFSLLVGTIPAAIIALLFGRQLMRPLGELAEASRRLSRGERVILPQPGRLSGVRDIIQAFNDMQESLVRFVNGRTQMLAAMSHDLRTPLTSLRIRAELIDNEDLRNAMITTLDEMGAMVEETLRFARDEAQQEATQEVAIESLIQQVLDAQSASGNSVRRTQQLDPGLHYRCRPVTLKRALHNIIDNAAHYGEVRVGAQVDSQRQVLRIEVDDDGPGIPPAQLEQVFEPFIRLDKARSAHTGGVGLGLSIARSSIRAHGGEISLHNRDKGGLGVVIEMPL
ncbi:ATP-binding protein [Comamonas composti]|uniref:ATP-binding protein n=1 Tax=Comamonas composti TaxID=408558 RepID=UPI00041EC9C7|nr:ATP-binding protein [Comamonas composti]